MQPSKQSLIEIKNAIDVLVNANLPTIETEFRKYPDCYLTYQENLYTENQRHFQLIVFINPKEDMVIKFNTLLEFRTKFLEQIKPIPSLKK